ncbi:DUF6371 domain-containing protein [Zobellia galactanivorans]|uniref:Uncharacterized protein n=1 Tax=Zobellia galactanivorans (strain DSM 12802 / CCUG 47099 / CIP 106680 / NCIMB 13871 / Dsij) TaxID=63186 RepID=G0L488_ZOBGA|nr:DUF6371 domain-containing protein [Zobellia galactanivorans]CAZ98728.1 Conserved hypothetical protein [Zobellia galactanivorans]
MQYEIIYVPYTPNSKKDCPKCGGKKTLTLFMNRLTGEVYPDTFGTCDRQESCGYNNRPKRTTRTSKEVIKPTPPKPIDYIDIQEVINRELEGNNHFFTFLRGCIGTDGLNHVKMKYRLGTSIEHSKFVAFPQIDEKGRCRQIKEMLYDPKTGKRKKIKGAQRWAFEKFRYPNLNLEQCFFGSHLIAGNEKPIALVESEKTALICSYFIPDYIWLATGCLTMLTPQRCAFLKGRKLILYPDKGKAFAIWKMKAAKIKGTASITVSDYLETKSEVKEGDDLADLILKKL